MEFKCKHCKTEVKTAIGTKNRNHCPNCLYSIHLDEKTPGDRLSSCKGKMKPIGITQKQAKKNKYPKNNKNENDQAELKIIHQCLSCNKISTNRIASDDNQDLILQLPQKSSKI
jgi:DNA-directed RNA polymerase subunit RPC12/RpoP